MQVVFFFYVCTPMGTLKQDSEEGGHRVNLPSFKRCTHFIHNWGDHILIKQALHLPVLLITCCRGPLRHLLCLVTFSICRAQHVPQHWEDRSSKASPVLTGDHSYIQHLTDTLHFFTHVTVWRKPVRHESWRRSEIFLTMQEARVNTRALVINRLITREISRQVGCSEVERQRYGGRG